MTKQTLDAGTIDKHIGEEDTEVLSIDNKPEKVRDLQINSQEKSEPKLELNSEQESKQQSKQESELSRLFAIYKDAYSAMIEATSDLRRYLDRHPEKSKYEDAISYAGFLSHSILDRLQLQKHEEILQILSQLNSHENAEYLVLDKMYGVGTEFNALKRKLNSNL